MSTLKVAAINHPSAPSGGLSLSSTGNVTGAGLDLIVTQTFSAAASVSVNNCFSSTYDNYQIVLSDLVGSTTLDIKFRLRVSGTDSSASYTSAGYGEAYAGGAIVVYTNAATEWGAGGALSTSRRGSMLCVYGPAKAQETAWLAQKTAHNNIYTEGGHHSVATAYDGFSLITSTGTVTGTLRVYGLRN